jgi:8-hydroxy-5-deazaflavin:NADPH oxidoreductase
MRIGIIGAGKIGATLARLFVQAGHEVAISNTRGPASLAELVQELGPRAQATTVDQAAAFGDLVVEAIPFGRYRDLPAALLTGKIVVTASNYYPPRDGTIDLDGRAQSNCWPRISAARGWSRPSTRSGISTLHSKATRPSRSRRGG